MFCSSMIPAGFDPFLLLMNWVADTWNRRLLTLSIGILLTALIQTREVLFSGYVMQNISTKP